MFEALFLFHYHYYYDYFNWIFGSLLFGYLLNFDYLITSSYYWSFDSSRLCLRLCSSFIIIIIIMIIMIILTGCLVPYLFGYLLNFDYLITSSVLYIFNKLVLVIKGHVKFGYHLLISLKVYPYPHPLLPLGDQSIIRVIVVSVCFIVHYILLTFSLVLAKAYRNVSSHCCILQFPNMFYNLWLFHCVEPIIFMPLGLYFWLFAAETYWCLPQQLKGIHLGSTCLCIPN